MSREQQGVSAGDSHNEPQIISTTDSEQLPKAYRQLIESAKTFECLLQELLSRPQIIVGYALGNAHYQKSVIQEFRQFLSIYSKFNHPLRVDSTDQYVEITVNVNHVSVFVVQPNPIPMRFRNAFGLEAPKLFITTDTFNYLEIKHIKRVLEQAEKRIIELEAMVEEAYKPDGVAAKRAQTHFESVQDGLDSE